MYQTINSSVVHYRIISFIALGLIITLILRYIYQIEYKRRGSVYRYAILITILSFIAALFWSLIFYSIFRPIGNFIFKIEEVSKIDFGSFQFLINRTFQNTFPLLIWSALYFGIKFWFELVEIKERNEKTSLLAQKSQLQMLRYQLNPHFLFNSLNSIQALVYDDPKHADRMITELSDFLRFTLRDKDKLFIPLGEEVRIAEKYLSMEKTRFPDRLDYKIEVTEQASKFEVIAFILQPFVENAVKHGMRSSPERIEVSIRAYSELHRLYIEIKNTGAWIENKENNGLGIKNVFDRLQMAYPDKSFMHIYKNPDSVCVLLEIYNH